MNEDVYFVDERNAMVPAPRPMPPRQMYGAPPGMRPWPIAQRAPYGPRVVVVQRPSPFANVDVGELVERGVGAFAALQSLPDAPTVCGDPTKDVANMIVYQEALAKHTKADERFRAFGGLAAQFVKVFLKSNQRAPFAGAGYSFGG